MSLKIIPLGGLGEIGMNCMVLETDSEIIVVDCGLMFSDLTHFGVEFIIPDFTYLIERKDKLKGFVLTHGHEDHLGAIPLALKAGLHAPIYASPFTAKILEHKLGEAGLLDRTQLNVFRPGEKIKVGKFGIQTVSVNHSIIDSSALIIDTPAGKIIHTGDFKIEPTPFIGSKIDMDIFEKAGDDGILLLMSDSTNIERHTHNISENEVYHAFEALLAAAEGLSLVSMFSSNVSRVGQVMKLASKLGKKVLLSGRSMEQNVHIGIDQGHLNDYRDCLITPDDLNRFPRNKIIVVSTGSQGESRSSLIRIANGEHPKIKLTRGDLVIMSSRFIPGNEKPIGRMINQLFMQGAEVLYESVHAVHTSGHATKPELQLMLKKVRPKFFLPIHGEYRHLVRHAKMAHEMGYTKETALIAKNGDIIELTASSCKIVDRLEENRVLIEGREGQNISKTILKERRHLGEKGVVFVLMARDSETREILADPQLIAQGLVHEDMSGWLMEEAHAVAAKVVKDYTVKLHKGDHSMDLEEAVRVELRRFFNANLGKKPTVLPSILNI